MSEGPAPRIALEAAELFFSHTGETRFPFSCSIEGDVPRLRGLGSSVTIRLGILMALDRFTKPRLSREEICALCAELEGHPDNAAAALFGGFTIITKTTNRVARFDIDPALKFVLFIPDFEVKTSDARTVVPDSFSTESRGRESGKCQSDSRSVRVRKIRISTGRICGSPSSAFPRKICTISAQSTSRCGRGRSFGRISKRFGIHRCLSHTFGRQRGCGSDRGGCT